jgi:hypothetical protein
MFRHELLVHHKRPTDVELAQMIIDDITIPAIQRGAFDN